MTASVVGKVEAPSFILIPGAGGMAWYWHRVAAVLGQAGREAIAVDLPGDDENAGLSEYANIVVRDIGQKPNVVLVAQSLGGFTAAVVCERVAIRGLVFVNAMIPLPGETAGDWWENTGATRARIAAAESAGYGIEFDLQTYFLHDVPEAVLQTGPAQQRDEAGVVFTQRCKFRRWPPVPLRVIASAGDRFFPLEFQRRVARSRLKTDVQIIPGGHLVALSNPDGLVEQLLRFDR
jgi:pimeloyl-ACP methyl ester carboxylesterase